MPRKNSICDNCICSGILFFFGVGLLPIKLWFWTSLMQSSAQLQSYAAQRRRKRSKLWNRKSAQKFDCLREKRKRKLQTMFWLCSFEVISKVNHPVQCPSVSPVFKTATLVYLAVKKTENGGRHSP